MTAATVGLLVLLAGCGGSGHKASAKGQKTDLITVDHWNLPAVTGPPSTANFCKVLTASYQHLDTLPRAANTKIRQEILADYTSSMPKLIAEAPASISASASYYFTNIAAAVVALNSADLNPEKVKSGYSSANLLSPEMSQATAAVTSFAKNSCHYTIGG